MKRPKFGTNNALFEYFLAEIFKKILSYLKSATPNFPNYKMLQKTKMYKFGIKNA